MRQAGLPPQLIGNCAVWYIVLGRCFSELIGLLIACNTLVSWDPPEGDDVGSGHDLGAALDCYPCKSLTRTDAIGSNPVDFRGRVHEDRVAAVAFLPLVQNV